MTDLGKADSFLRQTLRKTQGVLRTGASLGMTVGGGGCPDSLLRAAGSGVRDQ